MINDSKKYDDFIEAFGDEQNIFTQLANSQVTQEGFNASYNKSTIDISEGIDPVAKDLITKLRDSKFSSLMILRKTAFTVKKKDSEGKEVEGEFETVKKLLPTMIHGLHEWQGKFFGLEGTEKGMTTIVEVPFDWLSRSYDSSPPKVPETSALLQAEKVEDLEKLKGSIQYIPRDGAIIPPNVVSALLQSEINLKEIDEVLKVTAIAFKSWIIDSEDEGHTRVIEKTAELVLRFLFLAAYHPEHMESVDDESFNHLASNDVSPEV